MMNLRSSARPLDVVSAILLVFAVLLFVMPVRASIPPGVSTAAYRALDTVSIIRPDDVDVERIVAANVLSSSRRAPSVRYGSPDLNTSANYALPSAFVSATGDDSTLDAADEDDAIPHVYGIVNTDGRWRALLRLTESDVDPVMLGEGDKRGAYRIVSIRPNAVVVAGPSGQRTLRLARLPRSDSTGKQL